MLFLELCYTSSRGTSEGMVRKQGYEIQSLEIRRVLAAPAAPVIIEPLTNGEIVSRFDVHMEVDPTAYSDPDGNAHQATTWQIRETAASGGAVVWQAVNISDPLSKVHIHLGDGTFAGTLAGQTALVASHSYVLHATFTDSNNEVSVTSQRTFATAAGRILRNEMKLQSITTRSAGANGCGNFEGVNSRAFVCSITTTAGCLRSFQASCPLPTSTS